MPASRWRDARVRSARHRRKSRASGEHAKRDHRYSRRLRGRSHDQGRRGADLSDRRLCVRQRRAWRRAVQSRSRGLSATAASAIRPPTCWSAASPRSKAASRRCASSTGQAALNYAVLNVTELGCNIVSVPQLYGTTHTLFAHVSPEPGRIGALRRGRSAGRHREADRRQAPGRCSAKASAIRPATSATSRRSRTSRTGTACRSSSTTRWRRRSCSSRSITAPTSWCIR